MQHHGLLNGSVFVTIKCKNSAGTILQFELYQPLFTYNVSCSSNVNIVDWLMSMPAMRLFLDSTLTS